MLDLITTYWGAAYQRLEDMRGAVIYGGPDECADQARELADHGIDLIVFDTRLIVDDFEDAIELITSEILPRIRPVAAP